jgi:ParB-like chromosome segregation protein Spo0J
VTVETTAIETKLIIIRQDARKVDDATVKALAASIAEIGIINPLRVRPSRGFVDGVQSDVYEVIAGVHRLKAARKAGLEAVPCVIVDDDDLHAELAMIDENLCRAELSPADRASQTARRKAIYLELHPETARGVAGADARWNATDNLSFASETAAAIGKNERTVQRDAERGEKISDRALALVRGSRLDTGEYLDKLKKLPHDEQVAKVQRDRTQPVQARKPVKIADDPLSDMESQERQVAALMAAWNRASPDARQEFLQRIDAPVFDAGAS